MKWEIKTQQSTKYYSVNNVQLIMENCVLKNKKKIAESIHSGKNKQVCSWVECESVLVKIDNFISKMENKLEYNPRKTANWICEGENVDDKHYGLIYSIQNNLYFS